MIKNILISFIFLFLLAMPVRASSTDTIKPADESSKEDATHKELTSAIVDLNYKIEYLQSRYSELVQEIENLTNMNKAQQKLLVEQNVNKTEEEKIENLKAEMELVRTELSQIREDVGLMQSKTDSKQHVTKKEWVKSNWLSLSSFGFALIALLISL